jgi:hypothetical protein
MFLQSPRHFRPHRQFLRHLAGMVWALAMASQVFGIGVASFADVRAGSGMGAHVERYGQWRHYSHDESTCVSCAMRQVGRDVPRPRPLGVPEAATVSVTSADERVPLRSAGRTAHPPRAPPSVA